MPALQNAPDVAFPRVVDRAVMMAGLQLCLDVLHCALPGGSGRLGPALRLSAAAIEPEGIAGEDQRPASAPRAAGTLLVRADLPQLTERRPRERLVAPVEALLRVRGRS